MINVVGEAIDGKEQPKTKETYPIHRDRPALTEQIPKPKFSKQALK